MIKIHQGNEEINLNGRTDFADIDLYRELYYEHATSEQFHSELKNDMGLESLPSGKFATNALILNLDCPWFQCIGAVYARC